MLRAVIFDFDGVISDSEPLHLLAFNRVLVQYGTEITEADYYRDYLGFTDSDCLKAVADAKGISLSSDEFARLLEQKSKTFEEMVKAEGSIIGGVAEFLAMLRQNNVRIAICSGALRSDIETILSGTGLYNYFEVIVSADDVSKGKPDPEGFLLALKKLNETGRDKIGPGECVVVEDSHWGLEAAAKAKMHTLAVTNSFDAQALSKAQMVVGNLREVTIKELRKLCQ